MWYKKYKTYLIKEASVSLNGMKYCHFFVWMSYIGV